VVRRRGDRVGRIVALVVLLAALWPVVRLARCRPLRRKLACFPRPARIALTGAVLAPVVIGLVVWRGGITLAACCVAASIGAVTRLWIARPRRGVRRGLPPGDLRLLDTREFYEPDHFLGLSHRYGPVFKTCHVLQPMVCIVGMRRGRDLLRDHDDDLGVAPMAFDRYVPGHFLRYVEAPRHREAVAPFRHAISAGTIDALLPAIDSGAQRVVAALRTDDSALQIGRSPTAVIAPALFPLFTDALLGIGPDHAELSALREHYDTIALGHSWRTSRRRVESALVEIAAIVRREATTGDRPSVASALEGAAPGSLDDPGRSRTLIYLVATSWRDVSGLLASTTWSLAHRPDLLDAVRQADDPAELAGRVTREALRLHQSEYLMRVARRSISVDGYTIPKGWTIRICIRENHRDPSLFTHPLDFDPERFRTDPPTPSVYAPFGASRIVCLGEQLTLEIGRHFVLALATQARISVLCDDRPEFDGFHWQPASGFRVLVTERARAIDRSSPAPAPAPAPAPDVRG
jgi:cytochrome P450